MRSLRSCRRELRTPPPTPVAQGAAPCPSCPSAGCCLRLKLTSFLERFDPDLLQLAAAGSEGAVLAALRPRYEFAAEWEDLWDVCAALWGCAAAAAAAPAWRTREHALAAALRLMRGAADPPPPDPGADIGQLREAQRAAAAARTHAARGCAAALARAAAPPPPPPPLGCGAAAAASAARATPVRELMADAQLPTPPVSEGAVQGVPRWRPSGSPARGLCDDAESLPPD
eukprot:TRINITY_DN7429_c0_g7_i1.p1 TRINITY_DN7429_c0_g7~~TRINITY_DN7429_c0_g7_i1.p1  ORF type:complete len:259 (+),score=94.81 TRINITY_DN7429_c0_g7_i1:92-778(+)